LERFSICGVSLGGGVGIWLGAHAPARVEKLVVANTASHFASPESWNARIEAVRKEGMASIADAVVERWFTPNFRARFPAEVDEARRMLLAVPAVGDIACCEAVRDADLRADLASIRSPSLVIGGTDDPAVQPDKCRAIADAIVGARFIELPSAHLSNVEAAEAFNAAVLKFLTT
jgi:3-oxoadipate enol-lactonase